jgi:hypothetical protein
VGWGSGGGVLIFSSLGERESVLIFSLEKNVII